MRDGTGPNDLSDMLQQHTHRLDLENARGKAIGQNTPARPRERSRKSYWSELNCCSYAASATVQLPDDIKGAPTVARFTSRLKTQL